MSASWQTSHCQPSTTTTTNNNKTDHDEKKSPEKHCKNIPSAPITINLRPAACRCFRASWSTPLTSRNSTRTWPTISAAALNTRRSQSPASPALPWNFYFGSVRDLLALHLRARDACGNSTETLPSWVIACGWPRGCSSWLVALSRVRSLCWLVLSTFRSSIS